MILATMAKPTYSQGVQDAIEAISSLAEHTRSDRVDVRLLCSTLRSLHPAANARRQATRADKAESVLLEFARRIVAAAMDDLTFAQQRPEASFGNLVASVQFNAVDVVKWARFAASKKDAEALRLLEHIEGERPPVMVGT